ARKLDRDLLARPRGPLDRDLAGVERRAPAAALGHGHHARRLARPPRGRCIQPARPHRRQGEVRRQVRNLVKSFAGAKGEDRGRVYAVDDISLDVEDGELFTLLGPSGCGKTTTLRSIAGLETPDAGEITVAGRTLFSSAQRVRVPASERGLGMVFQSYAIWPHMNVYRTWRSRSRCCRAASARRGR